MIAAFNSIKVRLKLSLTSIVITVPISFNSIKVRLKLGSMGVPKRLVGPFNSIKVRLKHFPTQSQNFLHLFQFHKGAIETKH